MEAWIETVSGKKFHFLEPQPDEIDINDIGYALSQQCRFNGHCSGFYSVAEHSVYVASLLPKELKLAGLLHDAAEAYLSDIPSPIKQFLPEYNVMEDKVLAAIYDKFGVSEELYTNPAIKVADMKQLRIEAHLLLPSKGTEWSMWEGWPHDVNAGRDPKGYPPRLAFEVFMQTYHKLTKSLIQLVA